MTFHLVWKNRSKQVGKNTCCVVVEAAHCYPCSTAINLRSVVLTYLEPRPGPATSGGEPVSNMPATIEEIQGVVAGLSEVVKGLVGAIQAIHSAQTTGVTGYSA